MAVPLYMDVHVPWAITDQLRRRDVNILTAAEDRAERFADADLLQRATALGRVVFTQDIRFKSLAESWQRQGRPFAGLIFGHQLRGSIGQYVENLELIAFASEPEDWKDSVQYLPF